MKIKNQNGITLIALVITVIILLILAGVAITLALDGGGLFAHANNAATSWNRAVGEEENGINYYLAYLNGNGGGSQGGGSEAGGESGSLTIPEGLEAGDTVNWTPSGTYTWQADYYASDDSYEDQYLASGSEYTNLGEEEKENYTNMTISIWKVLSVENDEVTLLPAHSTIDADSWTGTVTLQGAQGYNNSVKLLNDACAALYGGKGITARSINIEDIEAAMIAKGKDESDSENIKTGAEILAQWKADYDYGSYTYGYNSTYSQGYRNATTGAFTQFKSYPEIFAQEEGSKIDGTATGGTLGLSRQTGFIGRTNKTEYETVGGLDAETSIGPKQTYYYGYLPDYLPNDGSAYTSIAGSDDYYWVASRCVDLGLSYCSFIVRYVSGGYLDGDDVFDSDDNTRYYDLRSVPRSFSKLWGLERGTKWDIRLYTSHVS